MKERVTVIIHKNEYSGEFFNILENYHNLPFTNENARKYDGPDFNHCAISDGAYCLRQRNCKMLCFGNFVFREVYYKEKHSAIVCTFLYMLIESIQDNIAHVLIKKKYHSTYTKMTIDLSCESEDLYDCLCNIDNNIQSMGFLIKIDDAIKILDKSYANVTLTYNYKYIIIRYYPYIITLEIVKNDCERKDEIIPYSLLSVNGYNIFSGYCVRNYNKENDFYTDFSYLFDKFGKENVHNVMRKFDIMDYEIVTKLMEPAFQMQIESHVATLLQTHKFTHLAEIIKFVEIYLKFYKIRYAFKCRFGGPLGTYTIYIL